MGGEVKTNRVNTIIMDVVHGRLAATFYRLGRSSWTEDEGRTYPRITPSSYFRLERVGLKHPNMMYVVPAAAGPYPNLTLTVMQQETQGNMTIQAAEGQPIEQTADASPTPPSVTFDGYIADRMINWQAARFRYVLETNRIVAGRTVSLVLPSILTIFLIDFTTIRGSWLGLALALTVLACLFFIMTTAVLTTYRTVKVPGVIGWNETFAKYVDVGDEGSALKMTADLLDATDHELAENPRIAPMFHHALTALFIQTTAALALRMLAVAGLL